MLRRTLIVSVSTAFAAWLPTAVRAQTHDHAADQAAHDHAGPIVDCTTLATPPWTGLPTSDREQVERLQRSLAELTTPEAARAAGFTPALGDIPGMGVHYVNPRRMVDGVQLDAPDHLLFATIDGEDRLVGAAYAFRDVPDTNEPIPFESDLARWHDHPQFASQGQTLHMLHVWFIPSSNGPFAGLNFWVPFRQAGIEPPSACWMSNDEDVRRIQLVSFALAPREWGQDGATVVSSEQQGERASIVADLDAAARAGDRDAWFAAADRFLGDLSRSEMVAVEATLRALTMAQMSTEQRESVGN